MTDKLNKNKINMDIHKSKETEKTLKKFTVFFLMGRGADHPHASSFCLGMSWSHTLSHFYVRTRMLWVTFNSVSK
jgi:hypothetical protein